MVDFISQKTFLSVWFPELYLWSTNFMIALLTSCNISILSHHFVVAHCFNLTWISKIFFICRIIATASLNFSQLKNFFSSFESKSYSDVSKFAMKVAFFCGALPFASTETRVGDSFFCFSLNSHLLVVWNCHL